MAASMNREALLDFREVSNVKKKVLHTIFSKINEFSRSRSVIAAKRKDLTGKGKGNLPNAIMMIMIMDFI